MSINRRATLLGALVLGLSGAAAYGQPGASITVFAAASLTDSLKAVADVFKARTGVLVTLSFGASSTLARQIEQGAQADIFLSADSEWMDYLQKKALIADASRRNILGNQLVLVAAPDARLAPPIAPHFDLAGALGDGKLALADPASAPAGKYAKAALTALGVWDSVASKVVPAENVRVALEYVARGEAPYGIVYATDAKAAAVKLAGVFPENSHEPIIYPGALTKTAQPGAKAFLDFLTSAQARAIFKKAGFRLL